MRSDPKTSDSERENNPLQKVKTSNTMENLNKNPDANANKDITKRELHNTKQIDNSNGNIINNDSNRLTYISRFT